MIRVLSFLFFTIISFFAISQNAITGVLINESGETIPFANIALHSQKDSSLLKGTTSEMDGAFNLRAKNGRYYIEISFLSYKTKRIPNINLENNNLDLGRIVLAPGVNELDEIEIQAEKSQMELKLDKRVFNVGKDLSNAGANAADILNNVPSVAVDIEGNVSLRGSQNVRVLIDGKPSTITGGSTADVLRQFQGNMIERVEVITNPSARYDAEGEVGIINIVLKKDERKGINGSVEAVAGYPDNYRTSFNLNFRKKAFNLFSSYGIGYQDAPGGGNNYQRFANEDTSYLYKSNNERSRSNWNQNLRLGADLFLNPRNTITLAGFYRFSDEENIADYEYLDLYSNEELFQRVTRKDVESEIGKSLESSINYTKTTQRKDEKFTIDLQWSESDDLEESDIVQRNFLTSENLLQKSSNLEANRTYLMQSDYVRPIGKDGLFETGTRITLRTIENEFKVEELDSSGNFSILDQYNNDFLFDERIYAGYIMYGNKINRFSYQFGARVEHSDIQTELRLTQQKNKWEYTNLFPSAHLSYELESKNSFQVSYSKRINRPSFRYLLPFQTFSDQRNLWRGNPNLQPEFTDSYELGYLKYFPKGSLFSSIYYRHRTGVIDRITTVNDLGFTERLPVNLATENNYGFEFNTNYKFTPKTVLNATFNFFRSITEGSYDGINLDNDVYTWSSRSTFRTSLKNKVDVQASFNYRAPQTTGQGKAKSIYSLDLSAAKDVMNGKGTIVASVRDLFNTRKRRSITQTPTLYSESEFQWRSRQFLLTFTYRIKQKKSRPNRSNMDFGNDDF